MKYPSPVVKFCMILIGTFESSKICNLFRQTLNPQVSPRWRTRHRVLSAAPRFRYISALQPAYQAPCNTISIFTSTGKYRGRETGPWILSRYIPNSRRGLQIPTGPYDQSGDGCSAAQPSTMDSPAGRDREASAPFLLKLFYRTGAFHR